MCNLKTFLTYPSSMKSSGTCTSKFSGNLFRTAHQRKQSCCCCHHEWHNHQPGRTKQQCKLAPIDQVYINKVVLLLLYVGAMVGINVYKVEEPNTFLKQQLPLIPIIQCQKAPQRQQYSSDYLILFALFFLHRKVGAF